MQQSLLADLALEDASFHDVLFRIPRRRRGRRRRRMPELVMTLQRRPGLGRVLAEGTPKLASVQKTLGVGSCGAVWTVLDVLGIVVLERNVAVFPFEMTVQFSGVVEDAAAADPALDRLFTDEIVGGVHILLVGQGWKSMALLDMVPKD